MGESGQVCPNPACGRQLSPSLSKIFIEPFTDVGRAAINIVPRRQPRTQLQEIQALNQTSRSMLEVQHHISAMQGELVQLNQQQLQLQSQLLDVQRRQLAVQEQQLIAQRIAAIQLQLQTEMMQLTEVRQTRQRQLKSAAFAVKADAERARAVDDSFVRLIWLEQLASVARDAELTPTAMEELGDKDYVQAVHDMLAAEARVASEALSGPEREECSWLLARSGAAFEAAPALDREVHRLRALMAQWQFQPREAEPSLFRRITAKVMPPALSGAVGVLGGSTLGVVLSASLGSGFATGIAMLMALGAGAVTAFAGIAVLRDRTELRKARAALLARDGQATAVVSDCERQLLELEPAAATARQEAEAAASRLSALLQKHPQLQERGYSELQVQ